MFEAHFGLRENPFSTSHDPRFVYPSPEHLEAVAHFRYGLQNNEGFVLVTGEVGTGKTTAIMDLVSRLPQHAQVALIQNTALSRPELIEEICRRFGVEVGSGLSKPSLLARLEQTLRERAERGQVCLLVVDEAQNLSPEMLEEIRLLSNFELGGGSHFLICLVGQPELEERLARNELRQLRQRIGVKYHLQPLDRVECGRYLHHRLRVAGGDGDYLFPADTVDLLHGVTNGIPREINIVAGQSMLNAYVDGASTVRPEHVLQVMEEFAFRSVLGSSAPQSQAAEATPAASARVRPGSPPAAPQRVAARPAAATGSAAPPIAPPVPLGEAASSSPPATASQAPAPAARFVAERPAVEPRPAEPRPLPPPATEPIVPASPMPEARRHTESWQPTASPPAREEAKVVNAAEPHAEAGSDSKPRRRIPAGLLATLLLVVVAVLAVWTGAAQNLWNDIFPEAMESTEDETSASGPAAAPVEGDAGAPHATPPESSPPRTTASAPPDPVRRGWSVQVASFQTLERALSALQLMEQRTGVSGFVVSGVGDGGLWHAVRLGSYSSRAEAQTTAETWTEREWIPLDRFVVGPGS